MDIHSGNTYRFCQIKLCCLILSSSVAQELLKNPLSRGLVSYQSGSPRLRQPPRFLVVFWVGVGQVSNLVVGVGQVFLLEDMNVFFQELDPGEGEADPSSSALWCQLGPDSPAVTVTSLKRRPCILESYPFQRWSSVERLGGTHLYLPML